MNKKYLKVKLILLISLIFCIVGGTGSGILLANMFQNGKKYVAENIKIETREIYRSKEKIDVLDLSSMNPDNIVIEKSTDGENSIEIVYNTKFKTINAEFDKKYPEKLNVIEKFKDYKNNQYGMFDAVEREINDVIARRKYISLLDSYGNTAYDEKIYVKLTDPVQLVLNRGMYRTDVKIDDDLIKRELDYKYYSDNLIVSPPTYLKGEFTIKGFNQSEFENYPYDSDDVKINLETEKLSKLKLRGDFYIFNLNAKNIDEVSIFVDGVRRRDSNIEISSANEVEVIAYRKYDTQYIIKYKDKDNNNREYVISSKEKAKYQKIIIVDAKTVNYNDGENIIKIK